MTFSNVLVLWFADQLATVTRPLVDYLDVLVLPGDAVPVWTPSSPEEVLPRPAAGTLGWGETLYNYGSPADTEDAIPAHIRLSLMVDAEGVLVRGVCRCDGRMEVLCREEASNRFRPDNERGAILVKTAGEVASTLQTTWMQEHQWCGTSVRSSNPPQHVHQIMMRHSLRAGAALVSGQEVPSYMGIVAADPSGSHELTVLTTLDGVPSVTAQDGMPARAADLMGQLGILSATRAEWLATRQLRMRAALDHSGFVPLAALYVNVALRYASLAHDSLPSRASMLEDPNTEWSVTVTVVTRDRGWVLKTPRRRRATNTVGVLHPHITPLAVPCDVLDGVLARELWSPSRQ